MLTDLDQTRLREALVLAETGFGVTDPNPRVGCMIGHTDGRVLGRGATQRAGEAHAEVMALRDAQAAGADPRGATVWVTLEPCAHYGRTPPCCDALIAAGIGRVVVAIGDPFPQVAGQGIARLRAAGIEVVVADPASEIAVAAHEVNIGFFSRVQRGRPWVRMKVAMSLDGFTALPDGSSQWITGPEARADGHAWRRRAGAVLTGIGTVLADDPRLDVRLVPTTLQPLRVVVDSRWRMPVNAALLRTNGPVLVVGSDTSMPPEALRHAGAATLMLRPNADGQVDLEALLRALAESGVNEVHVEGGPTLNGALVREGLVDEWLIYMAPVLLGAGRPPARVGAIERLSDAVRLALVDHLPIGGDLRLRLRPPTPPAGPHA